MEAVLLAEIERRYGLVRRSEVPTDLRSALDSCERHGWIGVRVLGTLQLPMLALTTEGAQALLAYRQVVGQGVPGQAQAELLAFVREDDPMPEGVRDGGFGIVLRSCLAAGWVVDPPEGPMRLTASGNAALERYRTAPTSAGAAGADGLAVWRVVSDGEPPVWSGLVRAPRAWRPEQVLDAVTMFLGDGLVAEEAKVVNSAYDPEGDRAAVWEKVSLTLRPST